MKVILETKDGQEHIVDIETAEALDLGAITRTDSRLNPPFRVFRYAGVGHRFVEVKSLDLGGKVDF